MKDGEDETKRYFAERKVSVSSLGAEPILRFLKKKKKMKEEQGTAFSFANGWSFAWLG